MTAPTQNQSETLKPCPFCGDKASIEKGDNGLFYAICNPDDGDCFISIGRTTSYENGHEEHGKYGYEHQAAQAWNTRALPSETPVADVVREALQKAQNCLAGFDDKYLMVHARRSIKEALALIDQKAAPDDKEKLWQIVKVQDTNELEEAFLINWLRGEIKIPDRVKNRIIEKALADLAAKVEALRNPTLLRETEKIAWDGALDAVLALFGKAGE